MSLELTHKFKMIRINLLIIPFLMFFGSGINLFNLFAKKGGPVDLIDYLSLVFYVSLIIGALGLVSWEAWSINLLSFVVGFSLLINLVLFGILVTSGKGYKGITLLVSIFLQGYYFGIITNAKSLVLCKCGGDVEKAVEFKEEVKK